MSGRVTVAVLAVAALLAGLASAGSAVAAQHEPTTSEQPGRLVPAHVLAADPVFSASAVADTCG